MWVFLGHVSCHLRLIYSNIFFVSSRGFFTKLNRTKDDQTVFSLHAEIKYTQSVWGFIKHFIDRGTWSGLEEFYSRSLMKAINQEIDHHSTAN